MLGNTNIKKNINVHVNSQYKGLEILKFPGFRFWYPENVFN